MEEGRVGGSNAGRAGLSLLFSTPPETRSAAHKINNVGSRMRAGRKVNMQVTFPRQRKGYIQMRPQLFSIAGFGWEE